MANPAETADDRGSSLVNGAMAVCLVLVLGAMAAIVVNSPRTAEITEESFVLKPPSVDAARLTADRLKHYGTADVSKAQRELDDLLEVVSSTNELQFATGDGKSSHDAQVLMVHHANELITAIGIKAFVPAGQPMYDRCMKGFEELMAAVRSGTVTAEAAANDPGEQFADYRKWCGKGYGGLVTSGVITAEGQWADATAGPLLFDIMNRFRWAAVLEMRSPPWKSLAPYEYELLTRWRISLRSVPIPKRVRWVVAASQGLPELPSEELIGSLLLEQGDATGALGAYEDACKKDKQNLELQKKCEFLRERSAPLAKAPQ